MLNKILNEEGYVITSLNKKELNTLRHLVENHWLNRLILSYPQYVKKFYKSNICDYHKKSQLINHSKTWPKEARVFSPNDVKLIKQLPFFKKLVNVFGDIKISDEEDYGWEEIYWRIVRPGNHDVGSLHADKWFWELSKTKIPKNRFRIKVWVSLFNIKNLSGLRVVNGSHKTNWEYSHKTVSKKKKPFLKSKIDNKKIKNIPTKSGDVIIFNDNLIHGGMPNKSEKTRISFEFTMLVKK